MFCVECKIVEKVKYVELGNKTQLSSILGDKEIKFLH